MAHLLARHPGNGIAAVSVEETEIARFTVTADGKALDRAFHATQGRTPSATTGDTLVLVKRVQHFRGGGFLREWLLSGARASTRKEALAWAAMIAEPA
jgi:hypothetical protein